MPSPKSHAAYLAALPPDRRLALAKLQAQLRAALPGAEETVSYGIPAFRRAPGGPVIAGFAATKKGCSYYPFSGTTLGTLAERLAAYRRTRSALHFDPARGLPTSLVRALVRARVAELPALDRGPRPNPVAPVA